jgi:hypothetical protein
MFRTTAPAGRTRLWALSMLLAPALAGCSSDRTVRTPPDTTNVVRRPIYDVEGERPFYLGGYAGANYDRSALPGR